MTTSDAKLLYVDRRMAHSTLKRRMWKMLPPQALGASAELLGFELERDSLVLDREDDIVIVSDFAIYDYRLRSDATTARERLLQRPPADLTPAEQALLPTLADAHVTLLRVVGALPDLGVQVDDLLGGARRLLVDRTFSSSTPGDYLVTRLLQFPEFAMTSAAGFSVTAAVGRELEQSLQQEFSSQICEGVRALRGSERSKLSARLVRASRPL
jgi:hypothetical protein